jgi:hypothetical protein
MTSNRILILAAFTLSLYGCASKEILGTTREVDVAGTCRHLNNEQGNIQNIKESTSKIEEFYEKTASKLFSGIRTASITNSKLVISIVDKSFFEQYSSPLIDTIELKTYYGHPVNAIVATGLYAGIPWLITDHFSDLALGCTERKVISTEYDLTKKTKTGKSYWKDDHRPHKLLISGFDKEYNYSIFDGQSIDIKQYILNTDISKKTMVKITCLDCDLLGEEEQSLFKEFKKSVEITADFREIKASLNSQEKAKKSEQAQLIKAEEIERLKEENIYKLEQAKRAKEAEVDRINKEKEDLKLRKESLGVPLEEFKEQCKQLGFKEKSTDFGDCVLQLNNSK